jgi:hypothetical protein
MSTNFVLPITCPDDVKYQWRKHCQLSRAAWNFLLSQDNSLVCDNSAVRSARGPRCGHHGEKGALATFCLKETLHRPPTSFGQQPFSSESWPESEQRATPSMTSKLPLGDTLPVYKRDSDKGIIPESREIQHGR